MCGVCGILNRSEPIDPALLQRMTDAMSHRGPDDSGMFIDHIIGLGHRRLSIIDLSSAGHGPMPNEDQTVWITYNGEVYNFEDYRQALIVKGHTFRSQTDTEVILHLYEEYGEACVEKLRGMFAFAIWDANRRRLLLARDRFGIKPLYYYYNSDVFVFASELRALLLHPVISREVNLVALDAYLALNYVPSPLTLLQDVYKLPPAHTLTVDVGAKATKVSNPKRYFALYPRPERRRTEQETVEQARELLEESIRLRLIGDVPVGAFLSGGVDSSSIVSVMSHVFSQPVKTFSIGFEDERYNELDFARTVADKFGTDHYELTLTPKLVQDEFSRVFRYMGEPPGDVSAFNNFFVSQLASGHVTVALAGDGGDEAFAGYDRYIRDERLNVYSQIPVSVRRLVSAIASLLPSNADTHFDQLRRLRNIISRIDLPPVESYFERMYCFQRVERAYLYHRDFLAAVKDANPATLLTQSISNDSVPDDFILQRQFLDLISYIPEDLMFKADRMSMCHSLEVRVPFLDHKLVEFAMTIPSSFNVDGHKNRKVILKKAVADMVPTEVMYRPKKGFALPYGDWLRGLLSPLCREALLSDNAWVNEYLNQDYIHRLLGAQQKRRFGTDRKVWSLLALELWGRGYLQT